MDGVCDVSELVAPGGEVLTRRAPRIAGANAARKEKRCACIGGAQACRGGVRRRCHLSHSRKEVADPACCLSWPSLPRASVSVLQALVFVTPPARWPAQGRCCCCRPLAVARPSVAAGELIAPFASGVADGGRGCPLGSGKALDKESSSAGGASPNGDSSNTDFVRSTAPCLCRRLPPLAVALLCSASWCRSPAPWSCCRVD